MLPCGMQSKKFPHELVITGNNWETAKQDACRIEHAISDTAFQKLKKKSTGNRIAHVGPALHNELSAPERGKKKPLVWADNFACPLWEYHAYRRF